MLNFSRLLGAQNRRLEQIVGSDADSAAHELRITDSTPAMIWMCGADKARQYFNKSWLQFTGRSLAREFGDGWIAGVHPDDATFCVETCASNVARRMPFQLEYRLRRAGGDYRNVADTGTPRLAPDGSFLGYVGNAVDITERCQSEIRLRESDARFEALADTDEMLFVASATGQWVYLNAPLRDYVGPVKTTRLGSMDAMHAEDRERLVAGTRAGVPIKDACRLRAADGSYANFTIRLRPTFDPAGRLAQWIGVFAKIDVEEPDERALARLTGKLLVAQDDERRRIADELHGSAAQNLAAASLSLGRLARSLSATSADLDSGFQEMRNLVAESRALIDRSQQEIRTLSYRLHPPMLDEMGLPSALRWYADESAKHNGVAVHVVIGPELLGRRFHREIEMALFRIAQQALGQAQNGPGVRAVWICLDVEREAPSAPDCLVLDITDDGTGLPEGSRRGGEADRHDAGDGALAAARERLRQLGGVLELCSDAGGTTVRASLPIEAAGLGVPDLRLVAAIAS